ncbi:MAG TPA: hypothetical protein VNQ73_02135 [Ilumatobacter sp.]|nr:hypothetical protein [Ilumatobacter sp.]
MATKLPSDLQLAPLTTSAVSRPLGEWLTTFHLATVVLDPYTNESSWVLDTAVRILEGFRGSDARVAFVVTADAADTRRFLGPLSERFLAFTDPDRAFVKAAALTTLPAFVFVRVDGEVVASAEGWDPAAWAEVADAITAATSWRSPTIPMAGDPHAFAGAPA